MGPQFCQWYLVGKTWICCSGDIFCGFYHCKPPFVTTVSGNILGDYPPGFSHESLAGISPYSTGNASSFIVYFPASYVNLQELYIFRREKLGSSLKTLNGWVNQKKPSQKWPNRFFFSWKRAQHPGRGIFHHSDHSKQGGLTSFYGMDHSMEFRYGLHKPNRYIPFQPEIPASCRDFWRRKRWKVPSLTIAKLTIRLLIRYCSQTLVRPGVRAARSRLRF